MMRNNELSRRGFILGGVALGGSAALAQSDTGQPGKGPLTASQVIDRIKANVGIPWREQTVDGIIAGSAETPVHGIVTTMMATLDVMQRAAASGKNFVITHEPTFYSHQDAVDQLKDDATYQYKRNFIQQNKMVSFHFHDHWHGHHPDGIAMGMARELGWEKQMDPENPRLFSFASATPLAAFARSIETQLNIRTLRVLGDPNLPVRRAIASWGYVGQFPGIPLIARPDVDVLIVGETREWELVEYAQDMIASGKKKALILMGHVVSEQAGMKYCAEWLKPFLPEVPVEFLAAPEPFWSSINPA
jgi:putative NIF3 family GTP cyclohydrolase 1 type 2